MIKIKRLHPNAIIPKYATSGAACFDLHAIEGCVVGSAQTIRTGISIEIPQGYAMMIYSRSGHGFNNSVRLANCVGVIDSDYRGEVMVKLTMDNKHGHMEVKRGDRIAQAMIILAPQIKIQEVVELSETERGDGGFGSTGN